MFLPNVSRFGDGNYSKAITDKRIVEFKGLNALPVIVEGEFSDMVNLSARNYPCLSPRLPRSVDIDGVSDMTSFTVVDNVKVWIRNNVLYYDGVSKGTLDAAFTSAVRQLVTFQDRIIIWPDKMYFDMTEDEMGSLEVSLTKSGLVFAPSVLDADLGNSVKYATIVSTDAFTGLRAGDGIEITGCTEVEANNKAAVIDHVSADSLTLYFTENAFSAGTETNSLTIARKVPDMRYICVANNRVWGCKGNTLYGSKLGSAEKWNNFSGISTDSYTVDVASPGDFTGCHVYGSYVIFLKADHIHKLIGTKPSNFQIGTIECPALGLEKGSNKSIAYISGVLYFKARLGIVTFTGGAPTLVSEKFGPLEYIMAVACTDGRRYYVSMSDGGEYFLYVLDTFHNTWHREDATQVVDFAAVNGIVFMLTGGKLVEMGSAYDKEAVAWSGTLGEFTEFSSGKKIHSKLRVRVELAAKSTLKIEYSADGGVWETAWDGTGTMRKSVYASIIPTRCDSFRVRLSGTGDCKVYQMDRVFSYGTEMG